MHGVEIFYCGTNRSVDAFLKRTLKYGFALKLFSFSELDDDADVTCFLTCLRNVMYRQFFRMLKISFLHLRQKGHMYDIYTRSDFLKDRFYCDVCSSSFSSIKCLLVPCCLIID